MGRQPCCDKVGLNRGRWTAEEDALLINYMKGHENCSWRSLPKNAGLLRCGKSCRLRWMNYLREDLKRGGISHEEEETIVKLHESLGNRWSLIAIHLPGRTDNEIKNYWNAHLSKKFYVTQRADCTSSNPCKKKSSGSAKKGKKKLSKKKTYMNGRVITEMPLKNALISEEEEEGKKMASSDSSLQQPSVSTVTSGSHDQVVMQPNGDLGPELDLDWALLSPNIEVGGGLWESLGEKEGGSGDGLSLREGNPRELDEGEMDWSMEGMEAKPWDGEMWPSIWEGLDGGLEMAGMEEVGYQKGMLWF